MTWGCEDWLFPFSSNHETRIQYSVVADFENHNLMGSVLQKQQLSICSAVDSSYLARY